MKKQQKQIVALGVLIVVAAMVWYLQSGRPVPGIPNQERFVAQNYQPLPVENPELHWDRIDKAQKTDYKSGGRNPFSLQAEPDTQTAVKLAENVSNAYRRQGPNPAPAPIPPTWPGNVSFFGYGTVPNGTARRAFLSVDGEVQVVGEGDTLLGRYRITQVNNGIIEFQDISTGLRNTKALDADKTPAPAA
jgi:hypothetical protein